MKENKFVSYLVKHKEKLFLLGVLFLSGCVSAPGSITRNVHFQDSPGVDTLLIPAEYREVYFNNGAIGDKHCRAPGPDFTVQASEGTSVGGSLPGVPGSTESVGTSSGQSALSLGGRSAEVLLARELMYRACELSLNINANEAQATDIYFRFLDAVIQLSKNQSTIQTSAATGHSSSEVPVINTSTSPAPSSPSGANSDGGGLDGSGSEFAVPNSTINPNE